MTTPNLPPNAVWFITGCSSGLGHHLATHLSKTPCRIAATARQPTTLSTLPSTPNILKLALDVTSPTSIKSALEATIAHFGRIDVFVNNAGYGLMAHTETVPLSTARQLMETNFWGAVLITQLALPILRDTNAQNGGRVGGVICQISSMGGRIAFPGNSFYHASKFALEGFTEAVAKEMPEEWGIRFVCVEPGGVKTRYAETSTKDYREVEVLGVYRDPGLPTNVLKRYKEDEAAMRYWAEPEVVVRVLYECVMEGVGGEGELPFRLPLGADSWGLQKASLEKGLGELERVRGVAVGTSGEGGEAQLESIRFLKL